MSKKLARIVLGIMFLGGLGGCSFSSSWKLENNSSVIPISQAPKTQTIQSLTALENSIFQQVNQYRQSRNLPPLKQDPSISEQAKIHSQEMAEGKVAFGHDGFERRVKAIARSISYRQASENVAFNQGFSDPATGAVKGWIDSQGHRKNMEGNFDLTGVGVARNSQGEYYFTQIFILRR